MKRLTLLEARKLRDLTQQELSDRAELAQGQISELETGVIKQPDIRTMDKLAKALSMDAFLSVGGLFFEEKHA